MSQRPDWAAIERHVAGVDLDTLCQLLRVERASWHRVPAIAALATASAMQSLAVELRDHGGLTSWEAAWYEAAHRLGVNASSHERLLRRWIASAKGGKSSGDTPAPPVSLGRAKPAA